MAKISQTNQGLNSDELLTSAEAARLLNISSNLFAQRKKYNRQFPAAVGKGKKGVLLYRKADIVAFGKSVPSQALDLDLAIGFLTSKSRLVGGR